VTFRKYFLPVHLTSGWAACQESHKVRLRGAREVGGWRRVKARSLLEIAAVCGCRHRRTCSMRGNRIPPRVRTWPTYPYSHAEYGLRTADCRLQPNQTKPKPKSVPTGSRFEARSLVSAWFWDLVVSGQKRMCCHRWSSVRLEMTLTWLLTQMQG